jgi:hypothetical protein
MGVAPPQGVAEAAAIAGQAEAVAQTITDPKRQARALHRVAWLLADSGNTHLARRVATAVCQLEPWSATVGLMLELDSSTAEVVAHLAMANASAPAGDGASPQERSLL